MSVVGIDFGNESCFVAIARHGGIETVDNDYSLRATPSCVAFGEKQRILGVAAKNQHITNLSNTIYDFKRFIGRNFDDSLCQEMAKNKTYEICRMENGLVGATINFFGARRSFSMEQIAAMLLTKLKHTTEAAVGTKISDCVVSCPSFFTNNEREALLAACEIAGLHVLRLMNDTTASALTYGFYRQDLPELEESPRNVVFVDAGHSSLQVFVCAFKKGALKMLASAFDVSIGGRDFDAVLADYFMKDFKKKYNIDVSTNKRAYIRLLTEVDKIKKQMSANSTKLPLNIECFMNDIDVSSSICRADFEELSAPLLARVKQTLKSCLVNSNLSLEDIHSVEIVGGSSRIPAIKHLIEEVFSKVPSTTLNQDEAVARGCAIQCAILSPTFKVREITIHDIQPYPIKLVFDPQSGSNGEMEIFPMFHPMPFTKMVTLYRRDPVTLELIYDSSLNLQQPAIGSYSINDIKPTPADENMKVKVKIRLDRNGVVGIREAIGYETEETEVPVSEPMEVDAQNNGTVDDSTNSAEPEPMQSSDTNMESTETPVKPAPAQPQTVKKQVSKSFDLPVSGIKSFPINTEALQLLIETEANLVVEDRKEKDRVDVKNALEEYIYSLRDKLDGEYSGYVDEAQKGGMMSKLNEIENWLYADGEDEERSVYSQKLDELKSFGDKIKGKIEEEYNKKVEEEKARIAQQQKENEIAASLQSSNQTDGQEEKGEPVEIPIHQGN